MTIQSPRMVSPWKFTPRNSSQLKKECRGQTYTSRSFAKTALFQRARVCWCYCSQHKKETKIEIFYFFPTGWIDRSLGAVRVDSTIAKVKRWWGRDDWKALQGMDGIARAMMVAKRFESELGYGKATVYPIHSERRRGRVMYHMIHATDHPEASPLMIRAYRKVSGRAELGSDTQTDFDDLWLRINADAD